MSIWELAACVHGWNRAHGGGASGPSAPSADDHRRRSEAVRAKKARMH